MTFYHAWLWFGEDEDQRREARCDAMCQEEACSPLGTLSFLRTSVSMNVRRRSK